MKWITTENTMFLKDEVSALNYRAETDQTHSTLTVFLKGGEKMLFKEDDADRIWELFQDETKPKRAQSF